MSNIIPADFSPEFRLEVYTTIKHHGIKRTEKALLEHGFHPSFVKAIIRNITRTMGW